MYEAYYINDSMYEAYHHSKIGASPVWVGTQKRKSNENTIVIKTQLVAIVASMLDVKLEIGVKVEKEMRWWNKYISELDAYRANNWRIERASKNKIMKRGYAWLSFYA